MMRESLRHFIKQVTCSIREVVIRRTVNREEVRKVVLRVYRIREVGALIIAGVLPGREETGKTLMAFIKPGKM